jgi:hypothetical protein
MKPKHSHDSLGSSHGPSSEDGEGAVLRAQRYRVAKDVVMRDVDGGLLLVNLASGGTWKLNATGAAVCREIERECSGQEVESRIQERFAVPPDVLSRDIEALIASLLAQGLIETA